MNLTERKAEPQECGSSCIRLAPKVRFFADTERIPKTRLYDKGVSPGGLTHVGALIVDCSRIESRLLGRDHSGGFDLFAKSSVLYPLHWVVLVDCSVRLIRASIKIGSE